MAAPAVPVAAVAVAVAVVTRGAPGAPRAGGKPAGPLLTCPKCHRRAPKWDWRALDRPVQYRAALVPVYKCPACRFVFAPLPPDEGA